MTTDSAVLPTEATVYIAPGNLAISAAITSTYAVTAEVSNFADSGGEEPFESRPMFGGANIDLVQPRTQIEVSFDVVMRYSENMRKWDSYKWGSNYESSGSSPVQQIYVQWTDGSTYYTRAYRNARGFNFEPNSSADGMLEGSMTFKLSPTDSAGDSNFKVTSTAASSTTWGA